MSRFTKAAAIEQIQARAHDLQNAGRFDLNNGTAQLLPKGFNFPKGSDAALEALIDRAVSYGYMMALRSVANDFDSGHLGVAKSPAKAKLVTNNFGYDVSRPPPVL